MKILGTISLSVVKLFLLKYRLEKDVDLYNLLTGNSILMVPFFSFSDRLPFYAVTTSARLGKFGI